MSTSQSHKEYVLGTGRDELERLGLQHRLWADAAHALWKLARIQPGSHVLDVGSGPGYASFDLAQLVTHTGRVVGVDESPAFIDHLSAQAAARHLTQLSGFVGDVHNIAAALTPSPAHSHTPSLFDAAYARWVLCFVKDPQAVVNSVAALLKPGGRFAVNDYFNYTSMTMAPRRVSHDKAVAATAHSWRERGGDPDIVGRLPRLMKAAGLKVTHLAVHQRIARPGDSMYHWPDLWWRTYCPKLVAMGLMTSAEAEALYRDLDEISAGDTDFIVVPPVFELVAVKQ